MPKRDDAAVKERINKIIKENFPQNISNTKKSKISGAPETSQVSERKKEAKKEITVGGRNIVWLPEISKKDVAIGGGKGANLAEMYNLKLPVPPAFIVTAKAYSDFLEKSGIADRINKMLSEIGMENTEQLEKVAKEIQKLIIQQDMPEDIKSDIEEAYENLSIDKSFFDEALGDALSIIKVAKEPVFVAIRSSATAEDLETASFAGQQETFLNIRGRANVIDAVKKCWASLFTARAIYYRVKKGFKHEETFIAVVVQKMINADKAGVTFSANPMTNDEDEIVTEAVFGLGEGAVSGAVAPDLYIVDKKDLSVKEIKVSKKSAYFVRKKEGETVKLPLPEERQEQKVLDPSEITRLAIYAKRLENHYGKAQDIEWAIESGNVYILQTRAITTLKQEIKQATVEGQIILEGLGASPGIATGKVILVKDMNDLKKVKKGNILVTKMTNPDMVVAMQRASAIVTDEGGMTAHAAIVSREVGIPCIVGTFKATKLLKDNELVTVDATNGKIYEGRAGITFVKENLEETAGDVNKEGEEENAQKSKDFWRAGNSVSEREENVDLFGEEYELPEDEIEKMEEETLTGKEGNVKRTVGSFKEGKYEKKEVKVYMNLSEPNKIHKYRNLEFDGIGLMRIEFMIASQIKAHPLYLIAKNEQSKYVNLLANGILIVSKTIHPKPIVVRFSDFKSNEYQHLEGGYEYESEEANPMMGFRGVSRYVSEQFEKAFRLECKAIKKVREECDNVWVMLPFVRTTDEVVKCLKIMEEEGLKRSEDFKVWLMAEVPSMALIPEKFAELPIDGVSIGSNDLTQLVLGVDRDSALLGRMGYFDERNPAVLKAIHNIIQGFHAKNKTVSICGQAPSVYPEIVSFLLKEGVDSLSVNPDVVNKVRQQLEKVS